MLEKGIEKGIEFISENASAVNATTFMKACTDSFALCYGLSVAGAAVVGAGLTIGVVAAVKFGLFNRCRGRGAGYNPLQERSASANSVNNASGSPTETTGLTTGSTVSTTVTPSLRNSGGAVEV